MVSFLLILNKLGSIRSLSTKHLSVKHFGQGLVLGWHLRDLGSIYVAPVSPFANLDKSCWKS